MVNPLSDQAETDDKDRELVSRAQAGSRRSRTADHPASGLDLQHRSADAVLAAPTSAVTATEKAQPETTADGRTSIAVVFTDAGARKIRDLSIAQRNKLEGLVVGDRLIWAPIVQPEIGKESVLTGNGPNGLTREEIERIMASLR